MTENRTETAGADELSLAEDGAIACPSHGPRMVQVWWCADEWRAMCFECVLQPRADGRRWSVALDSLRPTVPAV